MYKSWMWKQRSYREQFQGDENGGSAGGSGETQAAEVGTTEDDKQQAEQATTETVEASGEPKADEDDGEVVIGFEGDAPAEEVEQQAAPAWVKELRKADREKAKRIRELEAQVAAREQAEQPAAVAKPTLADCDFDEDVFEEKLTAYHEAKRSAKAKQEAQEAEAKKAQEAWETRLSAYQEAKAKLPVANFEEVEDTVKEAMSSTQLGIIVSGADKPEHLVYAIGSNAAKLKELASIKDPVKFAFAVARLETKLTIAPKKAAPAPEKVIRGSATATGVTDTKLARLEAEADRTGDRTAVVAYKRAQRQQAG